MQHLLAVGIDLGTTNSAVAYVTEAGQTAMLDNELGETTTPSVVYFEADGVTVGRDARKAMLYDPGAVAECAKRDIGAANYSRPIRGKQLPPEVIQACVLKHLKSTIDAHLDAPYRVVITVPAFFDDRRRKRTADAGGIAGLDVLDIVNEPTAAAMAYGEQHGYLRQTGAPKQKLNLLVYDLGGGTFDATVVELSPGQTRTLSTDGDVKLGGRDWDKRLAEYAAQKFESQFRVDPRDDPIAQARIQRLAEEAKESLSVRHKVIIPVDHAGQRREVTITRDQFEILTSDLLERTAHTTKEVVAASGLAWSDIDRILLAGGASRMPMVAGMLEKISGRVPDRSVNPDEAVARGAAVYAAFRLSAEGLLHAPLRFHVVDVNSHSLGIEGLDPHTGRRTNTILIPRNTPLPTSVNHRFVTREKDQASVVVRVLEGESSDPDACVRIGRAVLRDIPAGLPQGHPISVTYRYEPNGRLLVELAVTDREQGMTVELKREGTLADDNIQLWRKVVTRGAAFEDFETIIEDILGVRIAREKPTPEARK